MDVSIEIISNKSRLFEYLVNLNTQGRLSNASTAVAIDHIIKGNFNGLGNLLTTKLDFECTVITMSGEFEYIEVPVFLDDNNTSKQPDNKCNSIW